MHFSRWPWRFLPLQWIHKANSRQASLPAGMLIFILAPAIVVPDGAVQGAARVGVAVMAQDGVVLATAQVGDMVPALAHALCSAGRKIIAARASKPEVGTGAALKMMLFANAGAIAALPALVGLLVADKYI